MRTDLLIAAALGTLCLFLALLGFFLLDWGPLVAGVPAAVFVVAEGYFVVGVVQMAKERQTKNPPAPSP